MLSVKKREFFPVMLTPFKDNGEIDFKGLTELTEFYLKSGAEGLFSNCLSGEMFELTEQEKLRIIKHVVDVTGGAVRVVASGTFGGRIQAQADFVKRIYETGADAVIVIVNMLAGENEPDEVFNDRMTTLLDLTDQIPLGFYECPVPYKRYITPVQLKLFAGTKRIIYLKDTCPDVEQIKLKLKAGADSELGLYVADMGQAVEALKAGVSGFSCIHGNYLPELIVWLCDNFDNASLAGEVDKVQQFLVDNMEVMHQTYPASVKYYLQKRGLHLSAFTRQKCCEITGVTRSNMEKLQSDYEKMLNDLQIGFLL
jgi:4-hydroxy-tetrahydrodipicolinate synthase